MSQFQEMQSDIREVTNNVYYYFVKPEGTVLHEALQNKPVK